MSLDMLGHIDSTFKSVDATRTPQPGSYVEGKWIAVPSASSPHNVTLQPASDKEINNLSKGGERLVDVRNVYVNDGDLYAISPSDDWTFAGINGTFKSIKLDNRQWRNYCKVVVSLKNE